MIETVPSGTILNGRYRIERVLGSGGFGHVYLALDQNLHQPFAVKEYLVSGPSGQEQLMHEANVLSQLHHPNLPAFHDAFHEHGRYYVVLNYIEGDDLTDIIRNAQKHNEVVPVAQIMTWVLATCDAISFLHSQQPPVIHRDIKPDNIRIMPDGTATLVDLGNAKAAADGARTLFFIRHQGTPGYAPPEQYPGGSGTDTRSDVYAIGGTLYFALTGQEPPSVSARNQSMQQGQIDLPSLQEVLAKNPREDEANQAKQFRLGVSKPAKPAPRYSRHLAQLATLPPDVLGHLNLIIQKAMAMRPRERYQSVAEFANDLRKVVSLMPGFATQSHDTEPTNPPQNPYKTQPDLPMVYDLIQQTKAAQSQLAVDNFSAQQSSGVQPAHTALSTSQTTPPMVQETCPHCGTPHKPSSSFCPGCGAPLRGQRETMSTNTSAHNTSAAQAGHHTSVSTSASVQRAQVLQQGFPKSLATPVTSTTASAQQSFPDTIQPWNTRSGASQSQSTQQYIQQAQGASNGDDTKSSSNIGLIAVIVLLIVLIVLVAILVLLLIHHTHQALLLPVQVASISFYTWLQATHIV